MATRKKKARPVLVTTAFKGVFFGYTAVDGAPDQVKLTGARNCIYWESSVNGFMGLASTGPTAGSKIGPRADITVNGVTSVVECTPEAREKWER